MWEFDGSQTGPISCDCWARLFLLQKLRCQSLTWATPKDWRNILPYPAAPLWIRFWLWNYIFKCSRFAPFHIVAGARLFCLQKIGCQGLTWATFGDWGGILPSPAALWQMRFELWNFVFETIAKYQAQTLRAWKNTQRLRQFAAGTCTRPTSTHPRL